MKNILIAFIFSLLLAGSTSSVAYLLDPAIEKIFIEKNQKLMVIIPFIILISFAVKGTSLYLARTLLIQVGGEVQKVLQLQIMQSILKSNDLLYFVPKRNIWPSSVLFSCVKLWLIFKDSYNSSVKLLINLISDIFELEKLLFKSVSSIKIFDSPVSNNKWNSCERFPPISPLGALTGA